MCRVLQESLLKLTKDRGNWITAGAVHTGKVRGDELEECGEAVDTCEDNTRKILGIYLLTLLRGIIYSQATQKKQNTQLAFLDQGCMQVPYLRHR